MKRIPFEKWVLFHHVVHCVLLFSSPLYKIMCYGGDRVHRGCADFSKGFHRLLDYLFAWHIKEAAWESFPDLVTSLGQIKVKFIFLSSSSEALTCVNKLILNIHIECLKTRSQTH